MTRVALSAVVTTFENARTLDACLASLKFADELLVLDSGSSDATLEIARHHGARILHEPFKGYGPQKQSAIDQATHDWVLLLDADEVVTPALATQILAALDTPLATGFELPRCERMFWRWQHRLSKHNLHLRLFDRRHHRMGDDPIHAAPRRDVGVIARLDGLLLHDGEHHIASKVARINHYSSGVAAQRAARSSAWALRLRLLWYPPIVFLKQWLLKRHFLNGWAGYIGAVSLAYHAFLKDAKALECIETQHAGRSLARRLTQQSQRQPGDHGRDQHEHRPQ